jgi:hypothetical protein
MDRKTKDQTVKIICYLVGFLVAIYVFMLVLPYLVMFLALCGAWYLFQEYEKNNRRNRH